MSRVYFGGQAGNQVRSFSVAFGKVLSELNMASNLIRLETMSINQLRENKDIDSPSSFMDWMVGGDIHFMPCHFHQHLDKFGWSIIGIIIYYLL